MSHEEPWRRERGSCSHRTAESPAQSFHRHGDCRAHNTKSPLDIPPQAHNDFASSMKKERAHTLSQLTASTYKNSAGNPPDNWTDAHPKRNQRNSISVLRVKWDLSGQTSSKYSEVANMMSPRIWPQPEPCWSTGKAMVSNLFKKCIWETPAPCRWLWGQRKGPGPPGKEVSSQEPVSAFPPNNPIAPLCTGVKRV